jgi:hypothetical protein
MGGRWEGLGETHHRNDEEDFYLHSGCSEDRGDFPLLPVERYVYCGMRNRNKDSDKGEVKQVPAHQFRLGGVVIEESSPLGHPRHHSLDP